MGTSISFTMSGIDHCSGACTYCSAASSMNYMQPTIYLEKEKMIPFLQHLNKKTYEGFKRDWKKVVQTFQNDRNISGEYHSAAKENRKPSIHVDVWGGNPLTCFDAFKETVDFLEQYFQNWNLDISTSDNGLGLWNDEVYNYLKEHNIKLQISHDGIGEWLRLPFDPLYTEPYASYWNKAKDESMLTSINCTLSFYNYSFWKNINYWNTWLNGKIVGYIKLNHCYNSDYDIKTINKEGKWQDTIIEELKGKPIGNWNLHNGTNRWDEHALDEYFHELMQLSILFRDPTQTYRKDLSPYKSYIMDISSRFNMIPDHDTPTCACRSFQRGKFNIGEKKGQSDQTFVITTTGAYGECNLIDERFSVENPGGEQPESCKGCKWEFGKECNSCGSKNFPAKCEYQFRYMQFLEEIHWLEGLKGGIKSSITQYTRQI